MKKLFVISNSIDATSDALISLCKKSNMDHFRWNVDLWENYEVNVDNSQSKIAINNRIIDLINDDYLTIWRKPFINLIEPKDPIPATEKKFLQEQFHAWLHYVCSISRRKKSLRLVEPLGDRLLPKLTQLSIAKKIFNIPEYCFSTCGSNLEANEVITKPLGDPTVSDGKILYTTKVIKENLLHSYPWLTQSAIIGGQDITCVHILGVNYFYKCEYQRDRSRIDWRTEINSGQQSRWLKIPENQIGEWNNAANQFMQDCRLKYGRLDFILSKENNLIFLECNPNGQFGWLDNSSNLELHKAFFNAIQSEDSILDL